MTEFEADREIVLTNSPVSFVVMGASGLHRSVLVRSSDDNLDLVGLDNESIIYKRPIARHRFIRALFFNDNSKSHLESFSVSTDEQIPLFSDASSRTSYLTFAWKGLARSEDVNAIKDAFQKVSSDLVRALDIGTKQDTEWQISAVISLCEKITNLTKFRYRRAKLVGWLVIAIYSFLFVLVIARLSEIVRLYI